MKKLALTLALAAFIAPAQAGTDQLFLLVQDACTAAGQQLADQRGATLVGASQNDDGSCEVVLLLPAKDGNRPVREVVTVNP